MATSSIFTNFVIRGEDAVKQFVTALEKCEKNLKQEPKSKMPPVLTDRDAIRALVAKGE